MRARTKPIIDTNIFDFAVHNIIANARKKRRQISNKEMK